MGADEKASYVRRMFGRIARRYDLMNWLMTLGMDRRWRRAALAELGCRPGDVVLDVGTGTLDFPALLVRHGYRAVGVDLTLPMMLAGRCKLSDGRDGGGLTAATELAVADAQRLPFGDCVFSAVCNGFLLRNVADVSVALSEMTRVLRPGGRLVCLELTWPRSPLFRQAFAVYFGKVVPLLGGVVAGDREAYTYLPRSVAAFVSPTALAQLMEAAGLEDVRYRLLGFGTVALHVGRKPPVAGDRQHACLCGCGAAGEA